MGELQDLEREILDSLWLKVVLICFICVILGLWYALLTMPTETYYTPLAESVTREI